MLLSIAGAYVLALIVHELGHILFAGLFGIRILRVSLFLDPGRALIQGKLGSTEVALGWLPTGAYTTLAGFEVPKPFRLPERNEFRAKPFLKRSLVITAGAKLNMLLATCLHFAVQGGSLPASTFTIAFLIINLLMGVRNMIPLGRSDGKQLVHQVASHLIWTSREQRWASWLLTIITLAWACPLALHTATLLGW